MLQILLIITWLIFGTTLASSLFYKNDNNNQILGVTLSCKHASTPEAQKIIKGYKGACYLIFLIFFGISFLILTEVMRPFVEFYMLSLVFINFFVHWRIYDVYQHKIFSLKKEKEWIYPRNNEVTVDINVAREKGKAGITSAWVWLFFLLSFMPMVYLLLHPQAREFYPIVLSLIGPFCQVIMIFLYYQLRNRHTPVLSDNTEINKSCARVEERINTAAATLSAFAALLFWILFNFQIIFPQNGWIAVLSATVLIVSLLMIAHWHQKKIFDVENKFFGERVPDENSISEQASPWKWGFYNNPHDHRVMVPKRIASMGWTINIGIPLGKAIGIATLVLLISIPAVLFYTSANGYSITSRGSQISIDAPMYDMDIDLDKVDSVTTVDKLPNGTRTNGYGGFDKSFGHFYLKGYGKCMLYVYNDVDMYIVLKLNGNDPGYVIVNDKSLEKTEQLYKTIMQWTRK
jgi:uncharacterized membrane protein